jgi:hypothetical protein
MKNEFLVRKICVFSIVFLLFGWNNVNAQVEQIQTFAKLYGYVRWFYPGDEAAQIDWNKFAIYGVQKVEKAKNEQELDQILNELFNPIAPALQLYNSSLPEAFNRQKITPSDTNGLKSTSWMHLGVDLGKEYKINNTYRSFRVNRDTIENLLGAMYVVPIDSKFQGHEFKLTVYTKSDKPYSNYGYILFTSKTKEIKIENDFLISGNNTLNTFDHWTKFEKIIKPDSFQRYLALGFSVPSGNAIAFDSISLKVKNDNTWQSIYISKDSSNWRLNKFPFQISFNDTSSTQKLTIKIGPSSVILHFGEHIEKNIGNNLNCIMPLALYVQNSHTFPQSDIDKLSKLNQELSLIHDSILLNVNDRSVRIANVVIAWNVLQHFYPYFDVVKVDWNKVLIQSIQNTYAAKTETDYYIALCKMISQLSDGHGFVSAKNNERWGLPFRVDLIENKIVVIDSKSSDFLVGDIILSIDNKTAMNELLYQESIISGSSQLKRFRGLNMFSSSFDRSKASVKVSRNGVEKGMICSRYVRKYQDSPPNTKDLFYCGNGIYYLSSNVHNFNSLIPSIQGAKGLIINPSSDGLSWDIIPHITKIPLWSTMWSIPVSTYPDRENIAYCRSRWSIKPKEPFIDAKVVFINRPDVISAQETMMGIINNYKLAKTVGDTTAGSNGDVNRIYLLGEYQIAWTGLGVLKHDGSQLHLIGFRPDYPVSRTIKAIKEGRDEYFEKALEILNRK